MSESGPTPKWLYAWAVGATALGGASLLIPLYAIELGATPFTIGVLAAVATIAGAPGAFLGGRFADRTGHRRFFARVALGTVTIVLAVMPFIRSTTALIGASSVVWFAVGAMGPVLTLLVLAGIDDLEWQGRIAVLSTFQGVGWTGGFVLGALWMSAAQPYLSTIVAQRLFFAACAVCSGGAVVGMHATLPAEANGSVFNSVRVRRMLVRARRLNVRGASFPLTPGRAFGFALHSFRPGQIAGRFTAELTSYFGAVFLFFAGFWFFLAPLPIYLRSLGYGDGLIFGLYLVLSIGATAFYVGAGDLARRYSVSRLQATGLLVRGLSMPAVGLVGLAAGASPTGVFFTGVLFLILGVGWAIVSVTAATLVTRLAPPSVRGEALGMYAAVAALAGGLGSFGGGWLSEWSYLASFVAAGILVLGGAAIVYARIEIGSEVRRSGPEGSLSDSSDGSPEGAERPD